MRRSMVVLAAATLVGGAAARAVIADTPRGVTPVSCIDTVWKTTESTTSSTSFVTVAGMTDAPAAIYPIVINVSAVVSGAAAEFRILSTDVGGVTHSSKPGTARFAPTGGIPDSFAYQWIEQNQSAAEHSNQLRLQWRSLSGNPVHLLRGDMSVAYATDACTGA